MLPEGLLEFAWNATGVYLGGYLNSTGLSPDILLIRLWWSTDPPLMVYWSASDGLLVRPLVAYLVRLWWPTGTFLVKHLAFH